MAQVGPLPQRAPVGHGPRGLQRRRRRVVVLHPRPGPLARLPLGRGRHGRRLRRPRAGVPGPGAVERRRPDPQGASVRPDQRRGQPRRGREGLLLLRRQHPHPLVDAVALQVPAGRVPVRAPRRDQRRARVRRHGVRTHRHRRVRRRPVLRHRGRLREGVARRPRHAHHGPQPRRPGRAPRPHPAAVVPQHLVVGPPVGAPDPGSGRHRLGADRPPVGGGVLAARTRGRRAALLRERDQQRAPVRHAERVGVRQGRHRHRGRARRCFRGQRRARHEGGAAPARDRACGRRGVDARAPRPEPALGCRRVGRGRRGAGGAPGGCRRVLRRHHAARARRGHRRRHAPGAGRDAVEQAALLLRPRPLAARALGAPAARARAQHPQHGVVPHGQRRHHLDARHVGVPLVRRVGPRLPHRGARDGRSRLRQGAARPHAVGAVPPPDRPDPGVRVELQRREPACARVGALARLRPRAADGRVRRR